MGQRQPPENTLNHRGPLANTGKQLEPPRGHRQAQENSLHHRGATACTGKQLAPPLGQRQAPENSLNHRWGIRKTQQLSFFLLFCVKFRWYPGPTGKQLRPALGHQLHRKTAWTSTEPPASPETSLYQHGVNSTTGKQLGPALGHHHQDNQRAASLKRLFLKIPLSVSSVAGFGARGETPEGGT